MQKNWAAWLLTYTPLTVNANINITFIQFLHQNLKCFFSFTGLAIFFHNGEKLRKDAISLSIHKIRNILHWFEGQKQLHFYASSLLFVYEGFHHIANTGLKYRQADLGNKSNAYLSSLKLKSSCGQVNCSSIFEPIPNVKKENSSHYLHHHSVEMVTNIEAKANSVVKGKSSNRKKEKDVEVRMIDFAHVFSTDSSDDGYMYGLRSLLFVLDQILQD